MSKLILVVLISVIFSSNWTASARSVAWHHVEDKRPRADRVWAKLRKKVFEINVEHRFGIGKTDFVLDHDQWPPNLQLVFRRFRALEGIKVGTKTNSFEGAVSHSMHERVIELNDGFTAKRKGDSIYIFAPKNFVQPGDKSIHVEWVDFYRN